MNIVILEDNIIREKDWKDQVIIATKGQLGQLFDTKEDKDMIESLKYISSSKIEMIDNAYLATFHIMAEKDGNYFKMEKIGLYTDFKTFSIYVTSNKKVLYEKLTTLMDEGSNHANLLIDLLANLTENDYLTLETLENELNSFENKLIKDKLENCINKIAVYRKLFTKYKHYYEQLDYIIDFFESHTSILTDKEDIYNFSILEKRIPRLYSEIIHLKESLSQIQDTYHAQVGIKQNHLMKIFTIITAIFMPLQLLVGWYGMNFKMPEFASVWSYPVVILCSVVIVVGMVLFFKKKNWFK